MRNKPLTSISLPTVFMKVFRRPEPTTNSFIFGSYFLKLLKLQLKNLYLSL